MIAVAHTADAGRYIPRETRVAACTRVLIIIIGTYWKMDKRDNWVFALTFNFFYRLIRRHLIDRFFK